MPRAPALVLPIVVTSILAPALPEPPAPWSFPLVATVAPVVMGLAMWAVTRSPLSLLFAALGPLIAIGSLVDSRLQARRRARTEGARFDDELATALAEIETAHAAERASLTARFPPATLLIATWNRSTEVRLGTADMPSETRLDGLNRRARQLDDLADRVATLCAAPAVVDARHGIAIVESGPRSAALFRSVVVQLASRLPPEDWRIARGATAAIEPWLAALPQREAAGPAGSRGFAGCAEFVSDERTVHVTIVANRADAPSHVGCIVDGDTAVLIDGTRIELLSLERLSVAQAASVANNLAMRARVEGRVAERTALPATVSFESLAQLPSHGLTATIGVDAAGPVFIDLVAAGPHAIIGGTTGSGKSELLITWALALAATHSPSRLNLLLVDFKGGASFAGLSTLPHCVGVLTDLDATAAQRALESLAAEIRFRERTLAAAGARSIDEFDDQKAELGGQHAALARLVIIVDEFAAVASVLPQLHDLFADLAARGRSLGLHLILCTQRPAGVVRDAVFANVGVRVSLRVHGAADSVAVVGTAAAAELSAAARGRAILTTSGEQPREVQLALATSSDIAAIARAWPDDHSIRRPWCEPLPSLIALDALDQHYCAEAPCVRIGVADLPGEQSQPLAVWHPAVDGHLLVVGAARSGTSTALHVIAAAGGVRVARDPDSAWDTLARYAARVRDGVAINEIVVLDDLDSTIDALGPDHASALVDNLTTMLRSGAALGLHLAIATQRLTGQLHALLGLCSARLLLRVSDRLDHSLAGGTLPFDPQLAPGAGEWRGARVQVAFCEPPVEPARQVPPVFEPVSLFAVVSVRPSAIAALLEGSCRVIAPATDDGLTLSKGDSPTAIVGDVAAWQQRWGAIARLHTTVPVVFDGCTVADFRAVTQLRTLPPPISRPDGTVLLLEPSGRISRVRLGAPPT